MQPDAVPPTRPRRARGALCVRSAAPHHRPRARRRIGEALCAFCCSAPGAVSSVYGSDLARFTPTCACAVSRSRIMKPALRSEKPSQGDWLAPRRKGHNIGRARTDSFSGNPGRVARSSCGRHQGNRAAGRTTRLNHNLGLNVGTVMLTAFTIVLAARSSRSAPPVHNDQADRDARARLTYGCIRTTSGEGPPVHHGGFSRRPSVAFIVARTA